MSRIEANLRVPTAELTVEGLPVHGRGETEAGFHLIEGPPLRRGRSRCLARWRDGPGAPISSVKGPGPFNTDSDIDILADALKQVVAL